MSIKTGGNTEQQPEMHTPDKAPDHINHTQKHLNGSVNGEEKDQIHHNDPEMADGETHHAPDECHDKSSETDANKSTEETAMKLNEDVVEDQGHGDHDPKEESRDHNPNTADRKTHLEHILERIKRKLMLMKEIIDLFDNMLHDAEKRAVMIRNNSNDVDEGIHTIRNQLNDAIKYNDEREDALKKVHHLKLLHMGEKDRVEKEQTEAEGYKKRLQELDTEVKRTAEKKAHQVFNAVRRVSGTLPDAPNQFMHDSKQVLFREKLEWNFQHN